MKIRSHQFVLTKIIATLGPASSSLETMVRLIEEGTRVFRINFSHGTFGQFEQLLNTVREAARRTRRYTGVLGDLSGPKFRLGKVVDGGVLLAEGDAVELTGAECLGAGVAGASPRQAVFSVNNPVFLPEVKAGQRILLDDGNVVLECTEAAADAANPSIRCRVITGGLITSAKGVNLPDTNLSLPALTDWDRQCVDFAVEKGFDFLALSFVRSAADVRVLKDRLRELGARPARPKKSDGGRGPKYSSYGGGSRAFIPVIAKIEKPQALDDLESIVNEADVVMVARGDLGVEMDLAQVPVIQNDAGAAKVGRDHNTHGFSMWVAGGGFRGGCVHGMTDEFGHKAVSDIVNHFDYHATLLHLFGIDPKKLAYRHNGVEQSLLDGQPGQVVTNLLQTA